MWPTNNEFQNYLNTIWDDVGKWGDRRQELVFIGIGMDQNQIISQLDKYLDDKFDI